MPRARLALLTALTFAFAARPETPPVRVVSHVKVVSDKVEDVSSIDVWKASFIKKGMTDQQIAIHEGCTRCHISALRRALNLPFNRLPPAIHAVREALREEKLDRMTRRRPAPLPAAPTWANPGTEAKVVVMEARFTKRVQLFHPDDACYSSRRI